MLHYYLKLAYRSLIKTKISSLVNILGLCFGFTCVFYIAVWLKNELDYDRFHPEIENIYLIGRKNKLDAKFTEDAPSHIPYPERYEDYPEIVLSSKVCPVSEALITSNDKIFTGDGIAVTHTFFELFNFPFLRGTSDGWGDSTKVIFLTEKFATKLFGNQDAFGKTLDFEFGYSKLKLPYVIGGILKNPPVNSSIQFEFIVPWFSRTVKESNGQFWSHTGFDFVKLHPHADISELNKKLLHVKSDFEAEPNNPFQASVFPFTSIYLHSAFSKFKHGNVNYLWIMSLIGLAILILTLVNHINLTSSQVALRNKELSIRKLIGSGNKDFLLQFSIESTLFIFFSLTFAFLLIQISSGSFFEIVGQEIDLTQLLSGGSMLILAGILVVIVSVSAWVLSFYFNRFKAIDLLKRKTSGNGKLSTFKEKLMILQVMIAVTGIIMTIGLNMQLHLMMDKDPGYEKENIIKVELINSSLTLVLPHERKAMTDYIDNKLNSNSSILDYDRGGFPTETRIMPWQMKSNMPAVEVTTLSCGKNFFKLFGTRIVQGKTLSGLSENNVVLNESAVRYFQLKDPIGYKINGPWGETEVVGVVKDFSFESTGVQVKPMVIICFSYDFHRPIIAKIARGKNQEAIAFLHELHNEMKPGIEFSYTFFDEEFDKIYKRDVILSKMTNIAAALAVAISILGLFSLVLIFTKEKTKEIGIRKVLGAQVSEIINMIGYHFLKRMLVAFSIAVPLSYFAMHTWLENFAYKIELTWWLFASGGVIVFVLAFLTIAIQAYKSARANPIDSLRYE